jgi:hypothetical protein
LVLLAVDEAPLIDVFIGLVEALLVVVLPLLELPRVGDAIIFEMQFSPALGYVVVECSLELVLFGVDNTLHHLAVLP